VASAVGLVSIEIFGYRNPACKEYAVELGLALQITNILRDVARDLENDRIYIPEEDMRRFRYSPEDLLQRTHDSRFVELMQFEADCAKQHFNRATAVLPQEDRRSMVPARIMASIYHALLQKMEADRFQVFRRSYRLSKPAKLFHVAREMLRII
jgi:phytoene synthase